MPEAFLRATFWASVWDTKVKTNRIGVVNIQYDDHL